MEAAIDPQQVDIRLAVGHPTGEQPIKITCPVHKSRLDTEDDRESLAVYRKNVHCFGCGFHITRRYASLAFLLGLWDGCGDENSERVREAVRQIKPRLKEFTSQRKVTPIERFALPLDPIEVEAFHQFLLTYARDRLEDEIIKKRKITFESVSQYRIGHTGTHFTIPVYGLLGDLQTIRYRSDDSLADKSDRTYRKYDGKWGHNTPHLYPLPDLRGISELGALWLVEGEFDAIVNSQQGNATLTITNGAGNIDKIVDMAAKQLPLLRVNRWVIATDQDAAGEQAAQKVLSVLSGRSAVRARWEFGKDLNEYYARGGKKERIWFDAQGS